MDTVSPAAGWSGNEYRPVVRGKKLFGLGAADMKAGVAIAVSVFKELYLKTKANIILALVADEEGISRGAYCALKKIPRVDLCLIPEPSGEKIGAGARGRVVVKIGVRGRSAHGARPSLGINAIDESARIITEISKIPLKKDAEMGAGSICVLKIESGVQSLSVPEYCTMTLDRHYVRCENEAGIISEFRRAVRNSDTRAKANVSIEKRETPYLRPYLTEERNPLVRKFVSAYAALFGKMPSMYCNESVGDYNIFGRRMPTLIYGPKGANWHAKGEYVEIDSIKRCHKMYVEFLKGFK